MFELVQSYYIENRVQVLFCALSFKLSFIFYSSVDMRERQRAEYADHWSDVNIMGGRAYYDFDQHSLVIKHVKISDEGFYKCRMDFKQTPTKNFEIKLIVVGKYY